jgi:hypothetical protein
MKKLSLLIGIILIAVLFASCGTDSTVIPPNSDPNFVNVSSIEYTGKTAGSMHKCYKGPKQGKIIVEFTGETDLTTNDFKVQFEAANDTIPGIIYYNVYTSSGLAEFTSPHTISVDVSAYNPLGMTFTITLKSNQSSDKYIRVKDLKVRPE